MLKNKNTKEKIVAPSGNTDAILSHMLEHGNRKSEEANALAENHLQGVAQTNQLLENNIEASGKILDTLEKISENLKPKEIKAGETIRVIGEKGETGEPGHTPTDEELLALIKPLIPKVKDGHTPTEEELLTLIRPLIPQVVDGETPSDERLISLIRPIVNSIEVKDGKTPTKEDLIALIKPLMPKKQKVPTMDEIIDAIKTKIKWEHISDRPNLETYIGHRGGGPGYVREISDVNLGNEEPPDGYVLAYDAESKAWRAVAQTGGSGSGITLETPVGLINSSNNVYTVSHTPKYVVLNGLQYFENDGYTLSGLTITMVITPETGSTLRSAY